MWAASYQVQVDGFVARKFAEGERMPGWFTPISDAAAEKLNRIGHLPCGAFNGGDREELERRIMTHPEPSAAA